ncbi:uncharacterized protein LOC110095312 [Dendrobium catenatum]|uniref:Uncharacterized protein n=1 Tax=Dendrobium catenatum TaxID=906689 RepID=A0A2I0WYE6_9ASPA|nr:uncharacterized protein LOC110095312 [Dendrobium catenatum]PKU80678.1 hypothetical protein MA16_Dca012436 [Dendrobium catenatum]
MAELMESDVMWPEDVDRQMSGKRSAKPNSRSAGVAWRREKTKPVSIPAAETRRPFEESESESETEEMVPPHVLVSRRWSSASVAFSLSSGPGRALKGRDLRHVRNSVLRMTGFLEN